MTRMLAALFVLSLVVRAATAWTLEHPGYFDAFYYFHLAENMAAGKGLTENLVWNYLDQPSSLPRPGAQYWMPMAALWAWLGIAALPFLDPWRAAQAPFVFFSALLAPLSAWISFHAWGRRGWALSSGLLTLFSGFYFVYWVVPDNFLPFALAAALCFAGIARAIEKPSLRSWFVAGLGAGLSHLTRIDGALLVLLVASFWFFRKDRRWKESFTAAAGYLLVMAPWFVRNSVVTGTPLPGGGLQTLWMTDYSELFAYVPHLSLNRYLEWGIGNIAASKVQSAWNSALVILGATLFFMAPLVAAAVPRSRAIPLFRPVLWYSALLLTVMPLLFTFPAMHGSLLHSSAALVPWYMALVPAGLERIIAFIAARRRSWNATQAATVFGGGFVALTTAITLWIYAGVVWLPPQPGAVLARWRERTLPYAEVDAWLDARDDPDGLIFVDQPPLFTVVTGRASLAVPSDGVAALTRAAEEWGARYFLLDFDNAQHYGTLYERREDAQPWQLVTTFTDGLNKPVLLYRYVP